ncbi:UDP-3-O-(3-hydroxymyristoyl)glucosamine N-acyltransferase [Acidicapsa dinghuensis]|uniref:UDP-3-O-acylglucosamine N-acyltransferase n=1 Tax=Acidicapsa dinghuensis TaxID=2218256 RepID=A0ABW1ELD5_9BACT|nr:UDP-3-O-(3-hydroxymyristoyl)glucosamine N-acyltransferase [Acidicapsa dinghuensis]
MTLADLAVRLGAELRGDGDIEISGVRGIEEAGPSEITFIVNPKYAALVHKTQAAAVLVNPDFPEVSVSTLRLANPYLAFAQALGFFYQPPAYAPGIHPTAVVDSTAIVGQRAHIGAYAVIGPGARIGDDATILSHVVLYPGVTVGDHFFAHAHSVVREYCTLGDHVTLENGVVVGADGFGFAKDNHGRWQKIPQSGPVRIGSHVDVQANACIDRATVGETEIADGAKIDNLVQIGHGSKVGKDTLVCAQAGLAGSSVVGANAILAGQAGVAGHCTLGDGVILTAQSGVSHDVPAGKMLSGSPAFDNRTWLRAMAALERLPDMLRRINKLEKRLTSENTETVTSTPGKEAN